MSNNRCNDRNDNLLDLLEDNLNRVVTVFTDDFCFTGLLIQVSDDIIKLVVTCFGCRGVSRLGRITVIPVDKIVAVTLQDII